MAQYLPLPDGSSVTIREGESPQQAWARAQQMYPEAFQAKAPEAKETTVGGQAKEFFKGLLPGAIGMVESGAIGASALLPEEQEKAARAGIASIAGAAKKPFEAAPGYEETVGRKFGEAAGSIIPFLGLGPLGAAGRVGMAGLGAGAGAGEARTRAEQGGATEGERATATALGTAVGLTEMFAPARILGRVATPAKAGAVEGVKRALMAGGEEAAQEAASQAAQNLIAKGLYKPEQEIIESVGESAAYGGAVGAMAQGLFDLALGRRAKAPSAQQEEFKKLRAEEEARLEAERQRKATPEYAQQVVAQYDELAKQKQDLISQIKKIEKTSPTADADRAFNKDINSQIQALEKQIKPLAADYHKSKAQMVEIEKQAELAKMPVEDFMLQQMGMKVQPPAPPAEAKPEMIRGKGQLFGTEVTPPTEDTALQDYATGQFEAARGVGVFDMGDVADYMMQDPAKAAEMVQARTKLPGLTAADNNLLLTGVKLRLKEQERAAQAASKQELAQRQDLLKAQTTTQTEDQLALLKQSQEDVEEQRRTGEPNFDYLDPIFETALEGKQPVVKVNEAVQPLPRAPQIRERIRGLLDAADQADREYRNARYGLPERGKRGAPERGAAVEALARGQKAIKELDQLSRNGGVYAREVIAARRAQQESLAKLDDITEQLRTGQMLGKEVERVRNPETGAMETRPVESGKGVAASTEQSLTNKADQVRAQLIASALQEAALHRRADGQPALTQDEAIKAASTIFDSVNDWVQRANTKPAQAEFEDVVVQPAQMRADKIVRPAVTERREVKPAVQPISPAEIQHFQSRIRGALRDLMTPPEVAAQRVERPEAPLKMQFAATEAAKTAEARGETAETLGGELRRRTEFVRDKMAKMGAMRPAARDALNAAADLMDAGKATRDILDTVEPVVDAIVAKRDVKQVDIQAINDAIAAQKPTALEQQAEGQKALFPETKEDLGYIRMTPKAFANSPKIRGVWEALKAAREAAAKRATKQAIVKQRLRAAGETMERLKTEVDRLKNDTKFFWTESSKWSDKDIAQAYVKYPDIGNTPEEQLLVDKYLKGTNADRLAFSAADKRVLEKLFADFNATKMPEYQKRLAEATKLLAQDQRLDDLDNQLLQTMQNANENIRNKAEQQRKTLAVLRTTIDQIKSMANKERVTPLAKRVEAAQKQVDAARSKYNERVEQLFNAAHKRMDEALAEILDPEIKKTNEALAKAKTTLEKEKAELERTEKRVQEILAQPEGKDRMQLATYQQFRYEEKKSIIEDLEKQIKEHEADLENLMETRFETHDSAAAVLEAISDKKVQAMRDRVVALEERVATMRGEEVTALQPGTRQTLPTLRYPFAAQKYEAELKAAQASLGAAQKQNREIKVQTKTQAQQLEGIWKSFYGGAGRRRVGGVTEALKTPEMLRVEKLREEEMAKLARAAEVETKELVKQRQLESIDAQVADLVDELGAYQDYPDNLAELKKIAEDETTTEKDRAAALAKAGVIQNIESLEAQREVLEEGKPRKKQRAATAPSTAALSRAKPFRTGTLKMLEQASTALRAEREEGVYGEYESPDLRGLFRTNVQAGPGMREQSVKRLVERVMENWAITPEVKVLADESGLPDYIRAQAEKDGVSGRVPGVYDPNTKTVYLVSKNLHTPNDVVLTVAHEVAGHFGLREVLGGTYGETMDSLYNGNKAVRTKANAKMEEAPDLDQRTAVEEVLADMAETGAAPEARSALRRVYDAIKKWLAQKFGVASVTDNDVKQLVANARKYVQEGAPAAEGEVETETALYRVTPKYDNDEWANASKTVSRVVAQRKSWTDKLKANLTGLAFETQLVDRFAGYERLAKYMEPLKGSQMLYYLRMYDQRMNFVSGSVGTGAPDIVEKKRADGQVERLLENRDGANIANVVNILKDAKQYIGNGEAVNQAFTTYMAAIRAENKGIDSLNFGTDENGKPLLTKAMLNEVTSLVDRTPGLKKVFEDARKEYNSYNRDLLNFVAKSGALSQELVDKLVREDDYIPFYRERNGVVELVIGSESPIKIGDISRQPYLKELVGGDTAILDFMTSSVQNTNMLVDMGLRNLSTKNAVMELVDLKAATIVKKAEGPDVVKFKVDGVDRYAIIATEKVKIGNKEFETGVPADILVKGMEGIPTQMPFLFRVMAIPAQGLRKAVTLSPLYMARQLFRDSLAAPIMTGADFLPVIGALKEIRGAAGKTLERRGITGGQQFKGTSEDLSKILRDITEGKPGWMQALGKFEAMSMEADSLTRRAQYNSYIEQGLSEMEATLLSLESMNFNKRGASPSVHVANALIPFFNAQIQGLNVIYKALAGKMPFNDKLRIREKLLQRAGMMAGATIIYAMMMEDDEAYKNANPDEKYGNWFVRVSGLDEPVRVPIPFEIGYVFKAIPEALYNSMTTKHGGEEAVKAFKQILLQTIPGGSSYGIPQFFKPAIEAGLGKSFYTGRDILSEREKKLLPEEQYRTKTSEAAKMVGQTLGISPVKIEALVSGYTGTVGLAFLQAISLGVPAKETPEQAVKRLSEYPLVGSAFQPNDAGGIINSVYERMNEAEKVRSTVRTLIADGKTAEAQDLMTRRGNDMMQAELSDVFKKNMDQLTKAERAVAASNLSPEAKRKQLDEIRKLKIGLANTTREISDKTTHLIGFS